MLDLEDLDPARQINKAATVSFKGMSDTKVRFFISALSKHCGGVVVASKSDMSLDELSLEDVKPAFQEYGALVLRSFRSDVGKFLAFTAKFSDRFSSYKGGAFRGGT